MSLTDGTTMTMPVAPTGMGGNGWGGFGGDGGWWFIILFLAIFCGWGGNGWGNNNGGGATDGYILASDFANIERKLDGVNNGLCDSFYAMNTSVLNGFAGVTQAVNSGFQTAEVSRANQQAALMQQLFQMQMQYQNCCCENREAIAQVRYDMASQACDTRNTVQNATRDIIDNQNSNSRAILDFLTQSKMRDLENENQGLRLAASQSAQSEALKAYMSGQFAYYNPRPVPSFAVPAPYQFAGCTGSQYVCGACA